MCFLDSSRSFFKTFNIWRLLFCHTNLDKTIHCSYLLKLFSPKAWEKSFLRVKTFALLKRLKKYKLSFQYIILSKALHWNKTICQKDPIWCKIPFLHENTIFIKIFFIRFVNISQFWDLTMITYFVTDSRYDSPTWQSES